MAESRPKSRTLVEPLSQFDLSHYSRSSPIRSLSISPISDCQVLIYIGTQSGSLILLSLDPTAATTLHVPNTTPSQQHVSFLKTVSVADSPVESIFVLDDVGKVLLLFCDQCLFLTDSLLTQPLKKLGFLKGISVIAKRIRTSDSESTNLLENNSVSSLANASTSTGQRLLQKFGSGIKANGVKVKEEEQHCRGDNVFAVIIGKRLVLIELVNGSFVILKEIQCMDGVKTMVWLNDSIIVGTVNGYSLFSCVTGQSGVIFTLPDVSCPPMLKLLSKEQKVLLLVDNVGVFVDAHGQPVGGSLVFRKSPDAVGELSMYVVVLRGGKMELYHKKSGICVQAVTFGGEGGGQCIATDEECGAGKLLVVATPTKVICYQKVPSEEQIKDLLRKKDFKEAISLAEELECEGEMAKEMLSFVHAQIGFLLLFDLHFEEAVDHFLHSETMQPSEVFPFIMRDPNRWSLLVPRNRYWGLHPPPVPVEDVVDNGLMAIQRAIFLRKAGVETAVDDGFLSNPPSRAELLELAIRNITRYLEVSRKKELTILVKEGVDTLLMYLYRALNRVHDMENLASSENSCIVAVCFVTIRPLSKNTYRRINRWVAELLWLELVWIVDWWAGVKIKLFVDRETYRLMGKEHALVVSNHKSDIDWLVGWVLAQRSGCLGSTLAVMKKSSKFLPVIGWSMWFSEYLFLERNWAKDESTLKSGLQRLRDYPQPFWLALFVEGTRFTQAKLLAAQEYAASTGLPIPRNVLIPRTKGFVSAVSHMRSFVPAIYDVTVAIPKSSPAPTMIRLFKGQSSVMHVHLKRHLMKELPETDDAVAQWCRDTFVAKDALLDKHNAEDTFSDQELQEIPRPKKSLLVVISWASLVIFGVLKFLQWSSLLSSWKGIAFSAFGLGIVTVLMQILIRFSQSERSTPAKVVPSKPKNSKEPEQTTQDKQR